MSRFYYHHQSQYAYYESILTEIAAVLNKHNASPELTLMVVGNIATNVINQNVAAAQRKVIAEKFAQALVSSLQS
uniref:DUF1414 domain-containing protein n=1 Tax=Vibrio cholerae TaxID=666 RepID=UPI003F58D9F5